jgi:hypothetical protein
LLGLVSAALQRVGGELMPIEPPTDAPVIDRIAITVPDHPRQLTGGEGMGDRQRHEVLLDVTGQEFCNGGLPPRVGQLTPVDQPQEPIASTAAQGTPQPPIVEARRTAVLRQRTLLLQDGTDGLIAR